MEIICNRCEKEIENASPYNFYMLHKECFREHAEQLIEEFLADLKNLSTHIHSGFHLEIVYKDYIKLIEKWEARKK